MKRHRQTDDRDTRIRVAEYVMGHRIANGTQFLPGARNRILFGIQARRFKTDMEFSVAVMSLVRQEEAYQ